MEFCGFGCGQIIKNVAYALKCGIIYRKSYDIKD